MRTEKSFVPSPDQMALWPAVSGNDINGFGSAAPTAPKPVYWHPPESIPHGALQRWYYARHSNNPDIAQARTMRQQMLDMPLAPLASTQVHRAPEEWSARVKEKAQTLGADLVGITAIRPEWVFEGHAVTQRWLVMLGLAHEYDKLKTAPHSTASAEVVYQYARGIRISKLLASWLREQGHEASPHAGPMAGPLVLIPPAIECGFGELGKHGSIINKTLGSNFRLAAVATDIPLIPDRREDFGVEDYCTRCRACSNACPPDAIFDQKQMVRGVTKWYVDFDKCLPYFNETAGCGICIAICPWSIPGVGNRLLTKLSRYRDTTPQQDNSAPE